MYKYLITWLLFLSHITLAQENVGIGTTSPNPNAILHLESPTATPQGILLPRLTAAQRGSMSLGPTDEGLIVLDISVDNLFLWNGAAWEELSEDDLGNHTATTNLNLNGFSLTNAAGITSSGAINFLGLGGSGDQMVTVDNAGLLSNAPLPTDNQTLTFAGNNLGISGGNTVSLATLRDNLGNHTATTNLRLGSFWVSGDGDNEGIFVSGLGNVGINNGSPAFQLDVNGRVRLTSADEHTFYDGNDPTYLYFEAPDDASDYGRIGAYNGGGPNPLPLSLGVGNGLYIGSVADQLASARLDVDGGARIRGLGGSGNRMVTVDNAGVLGTEAIPNSYTGTGAAGQINYWTGSSSMAGSNFLFWDNLNARLGIGTNAPNTDLEIRKDNANSEILFHDPGETFYAIGLDKADGEKFKISEGPSISTGFNYLTINYSNRYMGIGTNNPAAKLEVVGADFANHFRLTNETPATVGTGLFFNAANQDYVILATNNNAGIGPNKLSIYDYTNSQYRVVLDSDGDFGINEANPNARLTVNSPSGPWIATNIGSISGGNRVVMGSLSGEANIGGHNAALSAWTDLYLNRDGGGVAIGNTAPTAGTKLSIAGNSRINDFTLFLRGGGDPNHGLRYANSWSGQAIDGPTLFGFSGGALGSFNGSELLALNWNSSNQVAVADERPWNSAKFVVKDNDNGTTNPDVAQFYSNNKTLGIGIGFEKIAAVGSNPDGKIELIPKGENGTFQVTTLGSPSLYPVVNNSLSRFNDGIQGWQSFSLAVGTGVLSSIEVYFTGNWGVKNWEVRSGVGNSGPILASGSFNATAANWYTLDVNITLPVASGFVTLVINNRSGWSVIDNGSPSFASNAGTFDYSVRYNVRPQTSGLLVSNQGFMRYNGSNFVTSGSTWTTSDRRYKRDIERLGSVMERLKEVNGYSYYFRQDLNTDFQFSRDRQIGFIAQEVESLFPELVSSVPGSDYKTVNYQMMTPVLLEGLKELNHKLASKADKDDLDILQRRIIKLEEENRMLQKKLNKVDLLEAELNSLRNGLEVALPVSTQLEGTKP